MNALLQFKEKYEIANFLDDPLARPMTLSWKNSQDCYSWDGNECNKNTGHISVLDLGSRLPDLSNPLEELQLPLTTFSGELPASIGILPSLSYLDISNCKFSGSILASLADLSNLKYLNVSINPFTAQSISFFSWVGKKKKLTTLAPEKINLYGKIPPSIGNSSQPMELNFADNQLSGAIPSQLMNLTQLTFLVLASNRLSGSVPSWFMNMTRLVMLELAVNKFHGEIPSSISQLQNLKVVHLYESNFSGTIELDNFYPMHALYTYTIDLSHNLLKGPPPKHYRQQCPMYIQQPPNGSIASMDCNLSSAITLDLSSNNLTSVLPICLGNISESLMVLNLKGNNFHGSIPELSMKEMQLTVQLTMLHFSNDQLQGNLSRSLANCKKLKFINFANALIMDTLELRILIL
ncbi:receptor-like protein 43 [Eucalyptus grandis]|uniref:receptor-like protein 43 n=1 Tax=Eucalyptus grandis TaxID=71139 RepID=UPI00192EBBFA|nr:receptor-like protein 43 [Eucalyptus grandis]